MNLSTFNFKLQKCWAIAVVGGSLAIFLSLLCASEWLLATQVVPGDIFYKQLKLYDSHIPVKAVALGDSHMSQGFDAPEGILNLGLAGESFNQINIKLRNYLKTHEKPETVILQISPQMFADYRFTDDRRDYEAFFGGKWSLETEWYIFDPNLRSRLIPYWVRFFKGDGFTPRAMFTKQGALLIRYAMSGKFSEKDLFDVKARVEQHVAPDDFMALDVDDALKDVIQHMKANGISVCLVTFPVSPVYREIASGYPVFSRILTTIEEMAEHNEVPYFNYWSVYDNYEYFRNQDHLNDVGAGDISKRIVSDCIGNS